MSDGYGSEVSHWSRLLFYLGVTFTLGIIVLFEAGTNNPNSLEWWDPELSLIMLMGVTFMVAGTALLALQPVFEAVQEWRQSRGDAHA